VIVSESRGNDSALFELIRALFPECKIRIASGNTINLETRPSAAPSRPRSRDDIPWEGKGTRDQALTITLHNESIRFTPDGKVSLVDAIRMVTGSDNPGAIRENLKAEHPELLTHCEECSFQGEGAVPIVGSEGLDRIWMLLLDYLPDLGRSQWVKYGGHSVKHFDRR
jgi:hypothetical protein